MGKKFLLFFVCWSTAVHMKMACDSWLAVIVQSRWVSHENASWRGQDRTQVLIDSERVCAQWCICVCLCTYSTRGVSEAVSFLCKSIMLPYMWYGTCRNMFCEYDYGLLSWLMLFITEWISFMLCRNFTGQSFLREECFMLFIRQQTSFSFTNTWCHKCQFDNSVQDDNMWNFLRCSISLNEWNWLHFPNWFMGKERLRETLLL